MDTSQSMSDAELDWRYRDPELDFRYRTWRTQWAKESYRLIRSCGYYADDEEGVANVYEDEFDEGWYFPLPQAKIRAQLSDLNERSDQGQQYPEDDYWRDRPDPNQMAETGSEVNDTQWPADNENLYEDLFEEDFDDEGFEEDFEEDFDDEGADVCVCGGDPCICMEE